MNSTTKNITPKKRVIGTAISTTMPAAADEVALEGEHDDEGEEQAQNRERTEPGFRRSMAARAVPRHAWRVRRRDQRHPGRGRRLRDDPTSKLTFPISRRA